MTTTDGVACLQMAKLNEDYRVGERAKEASELTKKKASEAYAYMSAYTAPLMLQAKDVAAKQAEYAAMAVRPRTPATPSRFPCPRRMYSMSLGRCRLPLLRDRLCVETGAFVQAKRFFTIKMTRPLTFGVDDDAQESISLRIYF